MKNIANIIFSVLFSVFILIIETGIVVVRCNHSGKYKITVADVDFDNDMTCNPAHGCMQNDFYKFAPDATDSQQDFDVAEAPLVAVLCTEYASAPEPPVRTTLPNDIQNNPPPKEIYKIFRALRI